MATGLVILKITGCQPPFLMGPVMATSGMNI
jgi:hypothetical protein